MLRKLGPFFSLLDQLAAVFSPLAVLGFLVVMIVVADGFGQHVAFLQEIDRYGVEMVGAWRGISSDGKMAVIELPHAEDEYAGVVIYTKHYHPASLAALREDQAVRVLVSGPPQTIEQRAVLADYEDEVRGYSGYFTEVFWPFVVLWSLMVIRPHILYLGLVNWDEALPGPAAPPPGAAPARPLSGPLASRLPSLRKIRGNRP